MTGKFRKNWSWERQNWANIVDFNVWAVLKLLGERPYYIREILKETKMSPGILSYSVLPRLLKFGLASDSAETKHRRILSLTERGKKVVGAFDIIGEAVKEARARGV